MLLKNKYCNYLLSFILLLALSGCTSLNILDSTPKEIPKSEQASVWQKNQQSLLKFKQLNSWTLLARIGVVSEQGSSSSQLDWINTKNSYNIKLNNMLTYGYITIENIKNSNQVTLNYQDKDYTAKSPEELLFKLTKLKLPISQLEYWILGLPSPNNKINKLELNSFALVEKLSQNNFHLEFDDYSYHIGSQAFLPGKIIIKTKGLYIKILAQSWYS